MSFLGHMVSDNGISVDPTKVEVVSQWKQLSNAMKVHSFLGLIGYYRRFIEDFSKSQCHLHNLLVKIVSSDEKNVERAFKNSRST